MIKVMIWLCRQDVCKCCQQWAHVIPVVLTIVLAVLQMLMAASDNHPDGFKDSLPAAINIYPLAKLLLYTVERQLDVKVSCSLQALIIMLLEDEERIQVGCNKTNRQVDSSFWTVALSSDSVCQESKTKKKTCVSAVGAQWPSRLH